MTRPSLGNALLLALRDRQREHMPRPSTSRPSHVGPLTLTLAELLARREARNVTARDGA